MGVQRGGFGSTIAPTLNTTGVPPTFSALPPALLGGAFVSDYLANLYFLSAPEVKNLSLALRKFSGAAGTRKR